MSAYTPAVRRPTSPFRRLLTTEAKLFGREPILLFWGIVFPILLTVIIGLSSTHDRPDRKLGGLRTIDVYVPVLMAFVFAILVVQALPAIFAIYREKGILRRMSTTPVSPARLLLAQVIVQMAIVLAALVLIMVTARVAFNVTLPKQGFGFVLALVLGGAALLALGAVIAAISSSSRVANGIGALVFFPMMFFAGLWVPRQRMPAALREIGDYTPLGAMVAAIQDSMRGDSPHFGHLAVLAGYAILLTLAAIRWFRWE